LCHMRTMSHRRILFYTDLTAASDPAYSLVLKLIRLREPAELHVVHALSPSHPSLGEIIPPGLAMALNPDITEVAERLLRDRYPVPLRGSTRMSFHVLSGVGEPALIEFISRKGIGQVVVSLATAQRRAWNQARPLLASLQERCPCSVVLVMGETERVTASLKGLARGTKGSFSTRVLRLDSDRFPTLRPRFGNVGG
jgi:hypothetical protein